MTTIKDWAEIVNIREKGILAKKVPLPQWAAALEPENQ